MPEGDQCQHCGRPLPSRVGRRGRVPAYCSAACRQRAYRSRHALPPERLVREAIAEVKRQARRLGPRPTDALPEEVAELSAAVRRLRRLTRRSP